MKQERGTRGNLKYIYIYYSSQSLICLMLMLNLVKSYFQNQTFTNVREPFQLNCIGNADIVPYCY